MSKSKTDKSQVDNKNVEVVEEETSPWYYFYSQGCGFCKKSEPIVDELNKEGHDILKLDVADKDNQGLSQELKSKYNLQCGTPWFINAETGKAICGYREKDIVQKWLDGEDIPAPPRPKGPMPKMPLMGVEQKEIDKWKEEYEKWKEENSHLPNLQEADALLSRPRPKTEPPKPPNPSMSDEELKEWAKTYDKWVKENEHLPNLQPSEAILQRFKASRQNGMPGAPGPLPQNLEARLKSVEDNLSKLMNHLGVK